MSGGIPSLALKDEDVTKFLASGTHIGSTNLDFQMEQYVFKRRNDAEGESSQKHKKKSVDCRRSTAAQFFVEEETVQQTVTADKVVQLLNEAIVPKEDGVTLKNLNTVKELIIYKEPKLLDNFLDEVVSFQHDRNAEVRRFVVQFIEEACKKDPQFLPKVIGNLIMMLQDSSVNIQKKVIQTTTQLYPVTIRWLCNAKKVDELMEATWASMSKLKSDILSLLDSDNEGLRALTIKFMECVVVTQTFKDQFTDPKSEDLSLDEIPVIFKIFRPRKLEDEAREIFQKIVDFHGASHVSSFNLMACMQVLTTIGRKRFEFFPKVLQAFESLHANLPPTLSQSQVSSVRKNLKLQLFTLVKHPSAVEFHSRISIMLSDLGATPQQISKCFPNIDLTKKRVKESPDSWSSKRVKVDETVKPESSKSKNIDKNLKAKNTAIDITAEDLVPKFSTTNVADLVLVSMLSLPEVMPAHFQSTYTPIAAAGTEPQIRHLSRLMATQLTIAGLGKGVDDVKIDVESEKVESEDEDESGTKQIQTVVGRMIDPKPKKQTLLLLPSGSQPKTSRHSKRLDLLQTTTKALTEEEAEKLCRSAYGRILSAEKNIAKRGAASMRTKILTTLATQFRGDIALDLKNYVLENPRSRLELAFNWLYQEYAAYRGFDGSSEGPVDKYEQVVNELLSGVLENDEQNNVLFGKFFIDLPYVTESMAESLKVISTDENVTSQVLQIAKNMAVRRPPKDLLFLGVVSDLTLHENTEVRSKAVNTAVELHEIGHLRGLVEAFALRSLKFLLNPFPPSKIISNQCLVVWTEDLTKVCLHLYLALLPINHRLIHDLGTVYVDASADIKRTILRALEAPVKGMSVNSPELLLFVENCPKGAETLITRIIHILTDKAPPSNELVDRVRDLYHKRVPDVRFLIPIINGLTKREVIAALPELIKLNPTVVKEVFHRLLGSNFSSPLTPAELLVALHNIDPAKCNLKIIIKATSLCFEEKNVYTQVVLAMVMQQLMEQDPLPILLMRTVIQSLANYPHLLGFVTNILQRLIVKKVWTQKKIWEGFIKCCQRTKPQSFQVLLQLPAAQLQEVLFTCADLRDPLCQYVESFTEHQKAHIPKPILNVLNLLKPKSEGRENSDESDSHNEPLPPGQDNV